MVRASLEILRAVRDTLLAFVMLSGGPLNDHHALLKLDNRPIRKADQCAS
jgi:hypothetical protein